jgi:hypothetical protein
VETRSLLISKLTERYKLKRVSIGSMGWIDGQLVCLGELNKKIFLQVKLPHPTAFQLNAFKTSLQPMGLHKKLIGASDRYCAKHGLQRVGPILNGILTFFQPIFLFFGIFGGIIGVNSSFDTSPEKPYVMMVMERFPESVRCYNLQTYPDAQDRSGDRVCQSQLDGIRSGARVVRKARQGFLYIPWLQPGFEIYLGG